MSTAHSSAPVGASGALAWPRVVRRVLGSAGARRMFLDRQAAFWLGEIDPAWSLTERRARVVAVTRETRDAVTFVLDPGARWEGHRAGQYVPVEVEVNGVRLRRCYSIASAPGGRRVSITVKRVAGGRVSSWLHDRVGVGAVLGLGECSGDFVLPEASPEGIVLVSGGSGITPVMSMLRDLAARDAVRDVVFAHCAKTREDVIFCAELEALAARFKGLKLAVVLDDASERPGLDAEGLRAIAPDVFKRAAFLCGPEGMMSGLERVWQSARASSRVRRERFAAPRPAVVATEEGTLSTLRLSRSGRSHSPPPGTLLEQLEAAGERPAYGCRMGICNTCRCTKRSGTVVDTVTGAVSSEPDEEIRLCTSVARSDVDLAL